MKNSYVIIFGGLIKRGADGKWRSGKFNKFRVLAGYYLYKNLPKNHRTILVASGGNGIYRDTPNVPSVAEVMKQELIQLGLRDKEVVKESKTLSTYHELIWTKKLLKKTGKAVIISNAYHLPRIRAFIKYLPEIKSLKNNTELISAEEIVIQNNKNLRAEISRALKSKDMSRIITEEQKGIRALQFGHYEFKK